MSVNLFEQFLGHDWKKISDYSGKITCITSLIVGIIALIAGYSTASALWSLIIGFIILLWEFPYFYNWLPHFQQCQNFLHAYIIEETKCIICIALSIPCFLTESLVNISGLLLIISALLYAFAAINKHADRREGLLASPRSQQQQGYQQISSTGKKNQAQTVAEETKLEYGTV